MYKKLSDATFYICKEILLNDFSKIRENILQLLTGIQFDICYVAKTRVGFKIAKTILGNSQAYVYSEVICL